MSKKIYVRPDAVVAATSVVCLQYASDPTQKTENKLENGGSSNPGDYNINAKGNDEEW